jgi:hypothetical protein
MDSCGTHLPHKREEMVGRWFVECKRAFLFPTHSSFEAYFTVYFIVEQVLNMILNYQLFQKLKLIGMR